jgi:hypothetical protein
VIGWSFFAFAFGRSGAVCAVGASAECIHHISKPPQKYQLISSPGLFPGLSSPKYGKSSSTFYAKLAACDLQLHCR